MGGRAAETLMFPEVSTGNADPSGKQGWALPKPAKGREALGTHSLNGFQRPPAFGGSRAKPWPCFLQRSFIPPLGISW